MDLGRYAASLAAMSIAGLVGFSAPAQSGTGQYPRLLTGRTIVIDPGHGGKDPGSLGSRAKESDLNRELAQALAQWFRRAGAKVILTWSSPEQMPPTRRFNVRQRVTFINQTHADVLIDIHCNAGGPYRGPQTFYWDGDSSYTLAHMIQEELQYFTHTRRQVSRIDQYVLRYATMPAVNVEVGFITNPSEERRLMEPRYQQELTRYIFVGTERWFLHARWPSSLGKAPSGIEMLKR